MSENQERFCGALGCGQPAAVEVTDDGRTRTVCEEHAQDFGVVVLDE